MFIRICSRGLAALVAGALFASSAWAGWLGFRNDLAHPVVIQSTSKVNGSVFRCAPQFLHAGEVTWDFVAENTVKQITICDGRAPRGMLHRFETTMGKDERLYAVQLQAAGEKGEKTVQAVEIPARPKASAVTKNVPLPK